MRLKNTILLSALLLSTNLYASSLQTANSVNHTTPKVVWQDGLSTVSQSLEINPYGKLIDLNNRSYVFLSHYPASQARHPFIDEGGFLESVSSKSPNEGIDFEQNPFIYGSGYHDTESGLEYMGARYYSANIGRFVAQDSVDLINRYNYGNANPIMTIDPDGHMANWINYTLNGIGLFVGAMAGFASGASALALSSAVLGMISSMFGLGAEVISESGTNADLLNEISYAAGWVSLSFDIMGGVLSLSSNIRSRYSPFQQTLERTVPAEIARRQGVEDRIVQYMQDNNLGPEYLSPNIFSEINMEQYRLLRQNMHEFNDGRHLRGGQFRSLRERFRAVGNLISDGGSVEFDRIKESIDPITFESYQEMQEKPKIVYGHDAEHIEHMHLTTAISVREETQEPICPMCRGTSIKQYRVIQV